MAVASIIPLEYLGMLCSLLSIPSNSTRVGYRGLDPFLLLDMICYIQVCQTSEQQLSRLECFASHVS